jgi:hypothetical protein
MSRFALLGLLILSGIVAAQPSASRERPTQLSSLISPSGGSSIAIHLSAAISGEWRLLSVADVRKELGITLVQSAQMQEIEALNNASVHAMSMMCLEIAPSDYFRLAMPMMREKFLSTALTDVQRLRLKQVVFQLKEREFGAHVAFSWAVRELGLRPDQLEDVDSIRFDRIDQIAKLVTSGERFDKVKPMVEAANGDTFEKMAEMLTRTQRERFAAMRGKVFEPKVDAKSGNANQGSTLKYPKELFGLYDLELHYLWMDENVRRELAITMDQANLITEAVPNDISPTTNRPAEIAKRHDVNAKAIGSILTKEQRLRLDQIMMQRRERVSPEAMCGHPAAVAELKISPIQLMELADGKSLQTVLTAEQLQQRPRLLGNPFDLKPFSGDHLIPRTRSSSARFSTDAYARGFLVNSDRLNLSADQIKKLRDLAADEPRFFELITRELNTGDIPLSTGPVNGPTPATAVADKYLAAVKSQCWNVLDEKQKSIARQILVGPRRRQ